MRPLTAPIFDIQRFSIHDGPGIRTLVFFKGCNLRCAWCQNPESQVGSPIVSFSASRCEDRFVCETACREGAIVKGDYRIDQERCTRCTDCIPRCPHDALRIIGQHLTPEQLFERLLDDIAYYESSQGGVTFSGGEPTLYPRFVDRTLDLCRERGIHTTIETCGTFAYGRWARILAKVQLIYFDLKIIDEAEHRRATGRSNALILDNARKLVQDGYPVEFRTVLVPGFTDRLENLVAIVRFLKDLNQERIHLLAYHNMGEAKIDIIAGRQPKLGLGNCPSTRLDEVAAWFAERGVAATANA